jgi:ferredoxin
MQNRMQCNPARTAGESVEVTAHMALIIDTARCQGHGRCALINPDLFDVNDDGCAVVLDPAPTGDAKADADRAIGNCPEQAISWSGTESLTTQ